MPLINFEKQNGSNAHVERAMIGTRELGRVFDIPQASGPAKTHFRPVSGIARNHAAIAMPEESRERAKRALAFQIAEFFSDCGFEETAATIRAQAAMGEDSL